MTGCALFMQPAAARRATGRGCSRSRSSSLLAARRAARAARRPGRRARAGPRARTGPPRPQRAAAASAPVAGGGRASAPSEEGKPPAALRRHARDVARGQARGAALPGRLSALHATAGATRDRIPAAERPSCGAGSRASARACPPRASRRRPRVVLLHARRRRRGATRELRRAGQRRRAPLHGAARARARAGRLAGHRRRELTVAAPSPWPPARSSPAAALAPALLLALLGAARRCCWCW